ncbi:hypothetical protein HRbin19_00521 [bacterium HR19]|nr:hypothetical protein HRbin19_00521 [bacterium HR19]
MVDGKINMNHSEDIEVVKNQAICKFLSLLIDYPTLDKFEKAKKIAQLLVESDIIPDYLNELCEEVIGTQFSEELQADWIDMFETSIPPYLLAWVPEKNPALLPVLDRIYASECAYVPQNEMPDNLSCVFEFISLLFSRRKYEKIKAIGKFLKYIEKMKEPEHKLYGKLVKSIKRFTREIIEEVEKLGNKERGG